MTTLGLWAEAHLGFCQEYRLIDRVAFEGDGLLTLVVS